MGRWRGCCAEISGIMEVSVKNKFFTRKFVPAVQIRRLRKGMVIEMELYRRVKKSKFPWLLFYIGLTIELLIVLVDKSNYINPFGLCVATAVQLQSMAL